jgi:hypothetical protein
VIVGVTGHRPDRLKDAGRDALHASVRRVLTALAETVPGEAHRLVSPLAEGSDRILAEEAAALGWALYSPLPFPRADYEKDFKTAASRREFDELLSRAARVHELDGKRDTSSGRESAYTAVGRVVLDVSEVLVAIWDGLGEHGEGGTAQVVREARERGLPTIWIPSKPPHEPALLAPTGPPRLPGEKLAAIESRFPRPPAPK